LEQLAWPKGGTTNQWDYTQSEKRSRYAFVQLDGRRNIFAVKLAAININKNERGL
jgi:hypothetical protein